MSLILPIQLALSLLLDKCLGEPKHFHPLIGFGNLANLSERTFNQQYHSLTVRFSGVLAWLLLVLPLPLFVLWLQQSQLMPEPLIWVLSCLGLYLCLGNKSLAQHAMQIYQPLRQGDLKAARHYTEYMVSRETQALTPQQMARATTESVLENGHDAVIASLVMFAIGGLPLAILHRLANTLDAMWGYKNPRYLHFGWCAARADDLLGLPGALVTTLLFSLQTSPLKKLPKVLQLAWRQAVKYKSFNGGLCMSSGAQVLNIKLGGKAVYHGQTLLSPVLGRGPKVQSQHIAESVSSVNQSAWLWVALITIWTLL